MRLLAQLVGVVLLVGFVGAYFWWIVAALAAVAPVYSKAPARSPDPTNTAYRSGCLAARVRLTAPSPPPMKMCPCPGRPS